MDIEKWEKIENIFLKYNVKPLVGVIPLNEDEKLTQKYNYNPLFWIKVEAWEKKGWTIAMHGYNHRFISKCGGINPVNSKSEFAGVDFMLQDEKIKLSIDEFRKNNIKPTVFFAPAHTFDKNTLKAIEKNTDIRIISDIFATNIFYENNFYFIPVQTGKVRKLPFRINTICLHPNNMTNYDFTVLENFIKKNIFKISSVDNIYFYNRKRSIIDLLLFKVYIYIRKIKSKNL